MKEENLKQIILSIKQKKELEDALKDIMGEAINVKKDYDDNPSNSSGSTVRIHEDSPFMSDSKALEGDKWKYALIPK